MSNKKTSFIKSIFSNIYVELALVILIALISIGCIDLIVNRSWRSNGYLSEEDYNNFLKQLDKDLHDRYGQTEDNGKFNYPTGLFKTSFSTLNKFNPYFDFQKETDHPEKTTRWKDYIIYSNLGLYVFDLTGELKFMIESNNEVCGGEEVHRVSYGIVNDTMFVNCINKESQELDDQKIIQFDLKTGKLLNTWDAQSGLVNTINTKISTFKNKVFFTASHGTVGIIDPETAKASSEILNFCSTCQIELYELNGQLWATSNRFGTDKYAIWNGKSWDIFSAPVVYEYIYPNGTKTELMTDAGKLYTYDVVSHSFKPNSENVFNPDTHRSDIIAPGFAKLSNIEIRNGKIFYNDGTTVVGLKIQTSESEIVSVNKSDIGTFMITSKALYKLDDSSFKYTVAKEFSQPLFSDNCGAAYSTYVKTSNHNYYDYSNNTLYFFINFQCPGYEKSPPTTYYLLVYNFEKNGYVEVPFGANNKATFNGLTFEPHQENSVYTITTPEGQNLVLNF